AHDFGKYTISFQRKLWGEIENDPMTHHSLLSAFFGYELLTEYLMGRNIIDEPPYKFLPLLTFFVIKHHHGNLRNIHIDLDYAHLSKSGITNISHQLKEIFVNRESIDKELEPLLQVLNIKPGAIFNRLQRYSKEIREYGDIEIIVEELERNLYFLKKELRNEEIIYFLLVQLFYSILIDSDKKHAGHIPEIPRTSLPEDIVAPYLQSLKKEAKTINDIRKQIRDSVLKNILLDTNLNKRIFTITAPTGTGKTLTSLSAALSLRKQLIEKLGLKYKPRIIYSLPFTSIIDQTFEVFSEVLKNITEFTNKPRQYILKHHYMAEIVARENTQNEEVDLAESLALVESWESEIIVTTFVQLFYTLIGYKNRNLKKFHNICNSILVLDEVQNIPIEYWNLVNIILKALARYFHCRIILMTATRPLIFKEGEYTELVVNYSNYFNNPKLNRVKLKVNLDKKTISKLIEGLRELSYNSCLFIFNTIDSSVEFFQSLEKMVEETQKKAKLFYLSANIKPRERKARINEIKEALDKQKTNLIKFNGSRELEKIFIVSTQVVEAGVDFDCDCVYRDMGPLDSIIQVAGRCNREGRLEKGDVYLVNLMNDKNKDYTGIYSPVVMKIVKDILRKQKKEIEERYFLNIMNQYFQKTKKKMTQENKLIKSIYELNYDERQTREGSQQPISKFKLIKDTPYKIDVFIETEEKDKEVWKRYNNLRKIRDPIKRKMEFIKFKNEFYENVISVPKEMTKELVKDEKRKGLAYVSLEMSSIYYDKYTGFKRKEKPTSLIL
ncbi:MAG: CRISPR-associated helicase Cas3', partial [Candidatus Hodarchaeales archaeon]